MKTLFLSPLVLLATACGVGVRPTSPPHQVLTIGDRRVIQSDGAYNAFPGVTQAANGEWVLSYRKGTGHVNTPLVILRRSADKGETWSPEVVYFDTSSPDPQLTLAPDGQLILALGKFDPQGAVGAAYSFSSDNGLTWGPFAFFSNPPSATPAGSFVLLPPSAVLYANVYGPRSDGSNDVQFWSLNSAGEWVVLSNLRRTGDVGINETAFVEVSGDRLLAVSRDDLNVATWAHYSDDFGHTWGGQVNLTPFVGVLQDPQLLQTAQGLLLVGRQFAPNATPHEMVAFTSHDGGATFGERMVLDTYTGEGIDGGYAALLLRDDGGVFVTYYADSYNLRQPDIKSLVLRWSSGP